MDPGNGRSSLPPASSPNLVSADDAVPSASEVNTGTSTSTNTITSNIVPAEHAHAAEVRVASSASIATLSLSGPQRTLFVPGSSGIPARETELDEFQSLLDAASALVIDTQSEAAADNIFESRSLQAAPASRSNALRPAISRQYSARPHVPGEDSGSDYDSEVENSMSDPARRSLSPRDHHIQELTPQWSRGPSEAAGALNSVRSGTFDESRWSGYDPAAEEASHYRALRYIAANRRTRAEATRAMLDRAEEIRREFQAESRTYDTRERSEEASTLRNLQTSLTTTTASSYDWGPEPQELHPSSVSATSQSNSHSTSRWRPSERLQDYAVSQSRVEGNEARQTPAHSTNTSHRQPIAYTLPEISPGPSSPAFRFNSSPRTSLESREHQDIVDRVERALEEYRIARRGLRMNQTSNRRFSDTNTGGELNSSARSLASPSQPGPSAAYRAFAARYGVDRPRSRQHYPNVQSTDHDSLASGPLFSASRDIERIRLSAGNDHVPRLPEAQRRAGAVLHDHKAENALRYLEALRDPNMTPQSAWMKASELGLHNQSLDEVEVAPLPMALEDLPKPAYTSWLEPGAVWSGSQSANPTGSRKARSSSGQAVRRGQWTSRLPEEQLRTSDSRVTESSPSGLQAFPQALEASEQSTEANEQFLAVARNNMQILEEAERNLTSMLERSERLLRENERQLQESEAHLAMTQRRLQEDDARLARYQFMANPFLRRTLPAESPTLVETKDSWSVKVSLHEVDWDKMTLTGTMVSRSDVNASSATARIPSTRMESFFTGEIIDFRIHGLETKSPAPSSRTAYAPIYSPFDQPLRQSQIQQETWKVGGPEADLLHWAGIGPFKRAVDAAIETRENENDQVCAIDSNKKGMSDHDIISSRWRREEGDCPGRQWRQTSSTDAKVSEVSDTERYQIKLKTMQNLLTSTKWLHENINESGWILMRWKERCFVPAGEQTADTIVQSSTSGNEVQFSATIASDMQSAGASILTDGSQQSVWGLTISGYYYVALNRMSGQIEGLYFDMGSAPFQSLKLSPHHPSKSNEIEDGQAALPLFDLGGLRTNFSLVEFK